MIKEVQILYKIRFQIFKILILNSQNNKLKTVIFYGKKIDISFIFYFVQDLESLKKTFDETETQIGRQNSYLNMTQNVLPGKNFDDQKYLTCC